MAARPVQRTSFVIRGVWAACLLVAGLNHARILIRHGLFHDYGGAAWPSALYWTSLTILDPVIAVLLFVRPRAGIAGAILLITTNVFHNVVLTAGHPAAIDLLTRISNPFVLSQIGFMFFVLATARVAWQGVAVVQPQER